MLNFYTHYISNDYSLIEDVSLLNNRVKVHNQRQADLKKEVLGIKEKLRNNGGEGLTGEKLVAKAIELMSTTDPNLSKINDNSFAALPTANALVNVKT